jgi:ABC-2 type transport system ATP-binding protein
MMNVIQTNGLTRTFGATRAVSKLTIEVPAGIVFGFLGPNGSGKTTTIRLLLGLLAPSGGRAEVLGFDPVIQGDEIRLRSGALLEHTGLYERLSAEDNLDFYGRVWRISAQERRKRVQELLTGLGLWERRKEPCGNWSRGMKQKLAIARVLLHQPELVFLDEPTAGLDAVSAAALHQNLLELAGNRGMTIFLTTHNLSEAEKLCARVAVIRNGELLMEGSPDELRRNRGKNQLVVVGRGFTPRVLDQIRQVSAVQDVHLNGAQLILDLNGGADVSALVGLMVSGGVQVEEVQKSKASFEEAFLELVA